MAANGDNAGYDVPIHMPLKAVSKDGDPMRLFLVLVALLVVLVPAFATGADSAADTLGVMYWTDRTTGIYRAARDGSEVQLVVPRAVIDSIAIDREGERLYWTVITDRGLKLVELWQGKLDGSLATLIANDLNWIGDVAFDPVDKKVYVASLGDAKIMRINADGSERQDFLVGLPPPSRLYLDAENRKLYWTSNSLPRIDRVNLDGSGREAVLTDLPGVAFGFSIDPVDQKIYWTSPRGTLHRAKLDGTEREQLASGLNQPDGLTIDVDNRKLYWAERGKISQSNLDGSGIEVLANGKSDLYTSLEILPPKE
jgi:sugar lactone lactonase YvrE